MTTNGWDIHGRPLAEQRSVSMTTTAPLPSYWTTRLSADYKNVPPPNTADQEVWKALRLAYLERYELNVQEEGKYRVWRWLGTNSNSPSAHNGRLVVWTERRPLEDPLPTTPGLWPADD